MSWGELNPDQTRQQILVSGLGGQGVLFVSRLLAEAAIERGLNVLTSEIHGMAQRGGTVVSHLKVGGFSAPLIREEHADGLIVLKDENLGPHARFLSPYGWVVVNSKSVAPQEAIYNVHAIDAEGMAKDLGYARGANLVLLGFLIARLGDGFFCGEDDLRHAIGKRFARGTVFKESIAAFNLGIRYGKE